MQQLVSSNEKMSSKRIAEKTKKEHKNVIRDIKNMLDDLILNSNQKADGSNLSHLNESEYEVVTDTRGYTSEILLNERLSLCLAAGYSPILRMAIIDDWAAMKAQQQAGQRVLSRKELALLIVEAEEEKERLEQENQRLLAENSTLSNKSEYVDKVLASTTLITTTTIAKELGMSAQALNKKLCELGVQYKHQDHYVLYARYQDKGMAETRTHQWTDDKGISHTSHTLVWTEVGRVNIHNLVNSKLSWSEASKTKLIQS